MQAAAVWAQQRGVRELASDSLLEDAAAYAAHIQLGFQEVERSVKYRMPLRQTTTEKQQEVTAWSSRVPAALPGCLGPIK